MLYFIRLFVLLFLLQGCLPVDSTISGLNADNIGACGNYNDISEVNFDDVAWTLVAVPDTQHYARSVVESGNKSLPSIANMKAAFDYLSTNSGKYKIKVVQGLGDITDWSKKEEFLATQPIWNILISNPDIQAFPVQGNHDNINLFNEYFPPNGNNYNGVQFLAGGQSVTNSLKTMNLDGVDYTFVQVEAATTYNIDSKGGNTPEQVRARLNQISREISSHQNIILATHNIDQAVGIMNNSVPVPDLVVKPNSAKIILANGGHTCVANGQVKHDIHGVKGFITDHQCLDLQNEQFRHLYMRYFLFKKARQNGSRNTVDVEYFVHSHAKGMAKTGGDNAYGCFSLPISGNINPPSSGESSTPNTQQSIDQPPSSNEAQQQQQIQPSSPENGPGPGESWDDYYLKTCPAWTDNVPDVKSWWPGCLINQTVP